MGSQTVSGPTQTAVEGASNEWAPRPFVAGVTRLTIFVFPYLVGFGLALAASHWLPPHRFGVHVAVWWVAVLVVSSLAMIPADRMVRRLVPLTSLLTIALGFPEAAPSRFKSAMRSSTTAQIRRRIDGALASDITESDLDRNQYLLDLTSVLTRHDRLTRGHSERVRAYSTLIGEELRLSKGDQQKLYWAALLHDIGKLDVPSAILNKTSRPDEHEWAVLQGHPAAGVRYLAPLRGWLGDWANAAHEHHLRWDGKGYPTNIGGNDISLAGRIVAIADAYDVMTSARSYKKGMSAADARIELSRCAGGQFDPHLVRAFLNIGLAPVRLAGGALTSLPALINAILGGLATNGGRVLLATTAVTSGVVAAPIMEQVVAEPIEMIEEAYALLMTDDAPLQVPIAASTPTPTPTAVPASPAVTIAPAEVTSRPVDPEDVAPLSTPATGEGVPGPPVASLLPPSPADVAKPPAAPVDPPALEDSTTPKPSPALPTPVPTVPPVATATPRPTIIATVAALATPAPTPMPTSTPTPMPTPTASPTAGSSGCPSASGCPHAVDDFYTVKPGDEKRLHVLANDRKQDGSDLDRRTLVILDPPERDVDADFRVHKNHVHYRAQAGFDGIDSFTYRICNEDGLCDTATVIIVVGTGTPQPGVCDATNETELLFSFNADRSGAEPLDEAAIIGTGEVFIFATAPGTTASVSFYLDDPDQLAPATGTEFWCPYDLTDISNYDPFDRSIDLSDIGNGLHTLTIVVTDLDGSIDILTAEFGVVTATPAPTPTATPEPTATPAPTPTATPGPTPTPTPEPTATVVPTPTTAPTATPTPTPSAAQSIVVSEYSTDSANANGDFIELYNAGTASVSLDGFEVHIYASAATPLEIVRLVGSWGDTLAPGRHMLLAVDGNRLGEAPDLTFATPLAPTTGIGIWDGSRYIDAVGNRARFVDGIYQPAFIREGTGVPPLVRDPLFDQSYERGNGGGLGNCNDTGNNSADFFRNFAPGTVNPQNSTSPFVECGVDATTPMPPDHLVMSEIRTDGPGGDKDEFIELFNPTDAPVFLGAYWILDDKDKLLVSLFPLWLAPGDHYLIGGKHYTGAVDQALTWDLKSDGGIKLESIVLGVVLDEVQIGSGSGSPMVSELTGQLDQSYQRIHGGCTDTDQATDFRSLFFSTPHSRADNISPCG